MTTIKFDEFWNITRYCRSELKNQKRLYNNCISFLSTAPNVDALEYMLADMNQYGLVFKSIIEDYIRYERTGSVDRTKSYKPKEMGVLERQLETLKFLHTPKTAYQICDKFEIGERSVSNDLRALSNGIGFLGSKIKVEASSNHGNIDYKSTVHPVFLPLNLSEVYLLVDYLPKLLSQVNTLSEREDFKGISVRENNEALDEVIGRIVSQLSDYALDKLSLDRSPADNSFKTEAEQNNLLLYLMKSGELCDFMYLGNTYKGKVVYNEGRYAIMVDGNVFPASVDDVIFIPSENAYK